MKRNILVIFLIALLSGHHAQADTADGLVAAAQTTAAVAVAGATAYLVHCNNVFNAKLNVAVLTLDDQTDLTRFCEHLADLAKNDEWEGVILRVNCGGGSATDFGVAHDLMRKVAQKKPVISLIMGGAYSAGYWVASAARHVIAHSSSGIGSIGVIMAVEKYRNVRVDGSVKADVDTHVFTAGKYKGMLWPVSGELTQDDKDYIQKQLNAAYDSFVQSVAENRNLKAEDHLLWADAQIFTAPQALSLGLIDSIGTILEAEQAMKEALIALNKTTSESNVVFYSIPNV